MGLNIDILRDFRSSEGPELRKMAEIKRKGRMARKGKDAGSWMPDHGFVQTKGLGPKVRH